MERQDHSVTGAQTSAFLEGNIALQLVIYSDGSCDVHIKLDAVAPFHCKLERMEDGRVFVESLSKTAKTFLNGVPVTKRTFVAHNSLLTVVDRNFKFLYPENSVYILKSVRRALCRAKKGVPLSPLLTSSSRCISEVSSFPTVVSSSPKPSPLQNKHVRTPTLSSQRRGLSTRERYGPTPTRPAATPPVVSVERHSLKRGSSKAGNYSSPTRKHVKVNAVSNTPVTSGSPSIRCLRSSSTSKKETSQTNNSSYYSLNANQTGQIGLFDVSSKLLNASSTLLIMGKSRDNILANVNSAGALDAAPDGHSKSPDSPVSQGVTSTSKRVSRDSSIRQNSPGSAALHNSTWAEVTRQSNTSLRVERRSLPKLIDSDQEVAKSQPNTSRNYLKEYRAVKKGVQFGPRLSPEQFDSRLPPSTPVRRGELPPSGSLQRTYASIVKHRRSTSMPPILKDGRSASSEQFGPQKASAKLRTKPNLRALSRNLMDSFIDDSTAALKNLANGTLDSPASDPICASVAKPMAFSKVSSSDLENTESGQSSKLQSVVTNDSNVDMDHEGRSHDISDLLTPIRTGGRGRSVQSVPSRRRGIVNASCRCPAGRTLANVIGIMDAKPNSRRGGSLASKLNVQLIRPCTSRSRNAPSSRVSFGETSFALRSSVQRSGTRNVSLSNYSTLEACLEHMGTPNAPYPGRSLEVRTHTNTPKIQSSSRLSSARRPARTSRTESFPVLSDTQGIGSDSSSVQPSETKPRSELRMSTRLSSVRSVIKTPDVQDSSRLSGIRELMKTPKSTLSPRLSGVRKFVEPRKVTVSPVPSGIRELVKAPKSVSSPGLSAVGKPVKTPNIQASSEMEVIRKLPESLELVLSPSLSGAQKLAKTPMVQASAELSDIEELVQTPKSVPFLRLSDSRKLAKTSQVQTSPKLSGVRKLVETPKLLPSPRLSGVRRLVNTPKVQASPQLSGIRELIKNPKSVPSPRLSSVKELVKTPEVQSSPKFSEIRGLMNVPRSLLSLKLSGLHNLMEIPNSQNSEVASQKNTTSRLKRSNVTYLPSLGKRRRLQKLKDVSASRTLPSALSEIRQTRSRTKAPTTGLNTSAAEVATNLDGEAEKVQKRKRVGRTKSVPTTCMESSASSAVKRLRKRLTPLAEPLSPRVSKVDQKGSVKMRGARGARSKANKGAKSMLSPQHSTLDPSVLSLNFQSENETKGSAFGICPLIVRPKKVGNRRTGPSPCGALDSPPLPPSTHQKRRGARAGKPTTTVIRASTSNRKRRASSGKSSIPQLAPLRRSKRTAPRGAAVSPSVQPRQVKTRKKVQFSNPEAIDIGGAASTAGVDEAIGGVGTTATGRKCRISSKLVSPKGGSVPRQTRQRRKVAASPTLKPLRRGQPKK